METNFVLIERQMVRQQLFTLYCVGGQDTEFVTGSTVFYKRKCLSVGLTYRHLLLYDSLVL